MHAEVRPPGGEDATHGGVVRSRRQVNADGHTAVRRLGGWSHGGRSGRAGGRRGARRRGEPVRARGRASRAGSRPLQAARRLGVPGSATADRFLAHALRNTVDFDRSPPAWRFGEGRGARRPPAGPAARSARSLRARRRRRLRPTRARRAPDRDGDITLYGAPRRRDGPGSRPRSLPPRADGRDDVDRRAHARPRRTARDAFRTAERATAGTGHRDRRAARPARPGQSRRGRASARHIGSRGRRTRPRKSVRAVARGTAERGYAAMTSPHVRGWPRVRPRARSTSGRSGAAALRGRRAWTKGRRGTRNGPMTPPPHRPQLRAANNRANRRRTARALHCALDQAVQGGCRRPRSRTRPGGRPDR